VKERERVREIAERRIMLSPNYGTRACKKGRRTHTVPSLRGKSSGIMSGNYRKRERVRDKERERETE
jgi:hypothetical protein